MTDTTSNAVRVALIDTANLFKVKSNNITVSQNGVPCGGIVGVGHAVETLRDQGYYVIACLEGKNSTRRRRLLEPSYKIKRWKAKGDAVNETHEVDPTDAQWQWKAVVNLLILMRVPLVYSQGKEADDIIAYLTHCATRTVDNIEIRIISNDSDYFQLLSPDKNVTMSSPMQIPTILTFEAVKAKTTYDPRNTVWYKVLAGDKADCVRGVPGIGDKTVKTFLCEHATTPIDSLHSLIKTVKAQDTKMFAKIQAFENSGGDLERLYRIFSLELFDIVEGMNIKVVLADNKAATSDVVQWFRKYHVSIHPAAHRYSTTLNGFHGQFTEIFPMLETSLCEPLHTPVVSG